MRFFGRQPVMQEAGDATGGGGASTGNAGNQPVNFLDAALGGELAQPSPSQAPAPQAPAPQLGGQSAPQANIAQLVQQAVEAALAKQAPKLVSPKSGEIRTVPMTDRLATTLSTIPGRRRGLVLFREDGSMLTTRAHRWWLGKVQRLAGVPELGPHALRHTFCSLLAERGAPVTSIQAMAGHKDLQTTQRYMHARAAGLAATVKLIEEGQP